MGEITFIVGGARSGKSKFAQKLTAESAGKTAYIATYECKNDDIEMINRVNSHVKNRPTEWETFEEPHNLENLLNQLDNNFNTIMIDCFTIFTSNMMMQGYTEESIDPIIHKIMTVLQKVSYESFIVSNEVGLGIVPDNTMGRQFRDMAGRVNQITADYCNNAYFVVSGIPIKIKGANLHL